MIELWKRLPSYTPADIAVGLTHMDTEPQADLFSVAAPDARERFVSAVDEMNARYGLNTVYLASIHDVRREAPTRVPFGPPPPLEEFDDTADDIRKPPTRYRLTAEQRAKLPHRG